MIDGGAGVDKLTYANISDGVRIDLLYQADPTDNVALDREIVINIENVTGSKGSDYIAGDAGVNVLKGNDGDDELLGRGGADRLIGGKGADTFVFEKPTDGADKIMDYTIGEDHLEFVSDNFGGIHLGNIGTQLVKSSGGGASGSSAQFDFDDSGTNAGNLYYDADGTGGTAAILIATLTFTDAAGLTNFSSVDFQFL
jgi:Ca2+-binding RTX toxin-like protein